MREDPRGAAGGSVVTDEELLVRIGERDSAALRTLFQRYHARVFHFVQRRLRDESLSEEVVADVFFEVWRSVEHFAGASRPSTWIFGIANFKSAGAHRDRQRHKRASVIPTNVEFLHRAPDRMDPAERFEAREQLGRVARMLAALPDDQREVVELAVVEGLPYEEISARLGVPEGTVKTRVARARARLRRELGRPGIGEEAP
jgi:RNA polymerase sigma-70 factor (ECF subfamily)